MNKHTWERARDYEIHYKKSWPIGNNKVYRCTRCGLLVSPGDSKKPDEMTGMKDCDALLLKRVHES